MMLFSWFLSENWRYVSFCNKNLFLYHFGTPARILHYAIIMPLKTCFLSNLRLLSVNKIKCWHDFCILTLCENVTKMHFFVFFSHINVIPEHNNVILDFCMFLHAWLTWSHKDGRCRNHAKVVERCYRWFCLLSSRREKVYIQKMNIVYIMYVYYIYNIHTS